MTLREKLNDIYIQNKKDERGPSTLLDLITNFINAEYSPNEVTVEPIKAEEALKNKIVEIVAEEYGVSSYLLGIRSKTRALSEPRFVCYGALLDRGFSLKTIGMLFAPNKPYVHGSIINGLKTINNLKKNNYEFRCKNDRIQIKLQKL